MTQITRVQELENLKQEAIARIKAVLDLRGTDYELIQMDWDDDYLDDDDIANIKSCASFVLPPNSIARGSVAQDRYVIALHWDSNDQHPIMIDTVNINGDDDQTFRITKCDIPCLLAIADRIDELEKTGIHDPKSIRNIPLLKAEDFPKIIQERDTYNPTGK